MLGLRSYMSLRRAVAAERCKTYELCTNQPVWSASHYWLLQVNAIPEGLIGRLA
jgi:hypothetical protein